MRIIKEECRILAAALEDFKYTVCQMKHNRDHARQIVATLTKLQDRLIAESKDKRWGRTSHTDFMDIIDKYCALRG